MKSAENKQRQLYDNQILSKHGSIHDDSGYVDRWLSNKRFGTQKITDPKKRLEDLAKFLDDADKPECAIDHAKESISKVNKALDRKVAG